MPGEEGRFVASFIQISSANFYRVHDHRTDKKSACSVTLPWQPTTTAVSSTARSIIRLATEHG